MLRLIAVPSASLLDSEVATRVSRPRKGVTPRITPCVRPSTDGDSNPGRAVPGRPEFRTIISRSVLGRGWTITKSASAAVRTSSAPPFFKFELAQPQLPECLGTADPRRWLIAKIIPPDPGCRPMAAGPVRRPVPTITPHPLISSSSFAIGPGRPGGSPGPARRVAAGFVMLGSRPAQAGPDPRAILANREILQIARGAVAPTAVSR